MELALYQVDAFAEKPFQGNPAAVCPLDRWLPDPLMQAIAEENNLSETAFFVPTDAGFHIRWFTPKAEVDLCGHATLASAFILFNVLGFDTAAIRFESRSGPLTVSRAEDNLVMDFPAQPPVPCEAPEPLIHAFSVQPTRCLVSEDYLVVFETEDEVVSLKPDMTQLQRLDRRGVIVTAPSARYDFVSRFFAPNYGIPEDPVTGSAFTQLAPYWAEQLGKTELKARQVSARGGNVQCKLVGDRVAITGKAVLYLKGTLVV
jgi:PhzF family phenazine biosynthesis protein